MNDLPKRRLQFGIRTLLEIITVVALVLAIIYGKSAPGEIGRYQMVTAGQANHQVLVLDSKTGKIWSRHYASTTGWQELQPGVPEFDE
jgi:hypothetical protein